MTTSDWFAAVLVAVTVFPACHDGTPPAEPPQPGAAAPAEPASSVAAPPASSEPSAAAVIPPVAPVASSEPAPAASAAPAASSETPPVASAEPKKEPAHAHAAPTGAAAAPAASDYTGPDPCETKNFHFAAIANACHSGGRKAAKGVMKGVVKKANDAGTELKCTSCHQDMSTFHLKANALSDLKNWL